MKLFGEIAKPMIFQTDKLEKPKIPSKNYLIFLYFVVVKNFWVCVINISLVKQHEDIKFKFVCLVDWSQREAWPKFRNKFRQKYLYMPML